MGELGIRSVRQGHQGTGYRPAYLKLIRSPLALSAGWSDGVRDGHADGAGARRCWPATCTCLSTRGERLPDKSTCTGT